jgi:hypothetical protein
MNRDSCTRISKSRSITKTTILTLIVLLIFHIDEIYPFDKIVVYF